MSPAPSVCGIAAPAVPPAMRAAARAAVWAKIAPFAAWVLLGSLLTNLFGVVDRYMIIHFSRMSAAEALDAVGNYHSSRVVPLLLVSIAAMLATMIMPHLSHDWEAGRRQQVAARLRLFLKLFGFALFAAAVAVLLAAPLLFQVALRGKFPGGQAVLPWTLVYCTWFGLSLVAQNYLLCAEKARLVSVALFCGLLLNVPLERRAVAAAGTARRRAVDRRRQRPVVGADLPASIAAWVSTSTRAPSWCWCCQCWCVWARGWPCSPWWPWPLTPPGPIGCSRPKRSGSLPRARRSTANGAGWIA